MEQLIEVIQKGVAAVDVGDELKRAAFANLHEWLTDPRFIEYRGALESLIREGKWELLIDSFYTMLPFGTGGRRGPVGIGPNRINPFTVTTLVQGHCLFLKKRFPGEALKVVIAADVRKFLDLRGLYDRESLGRLYGLTSRDLAMMAAEVYAANGIVSYMIDPSTDTYLSTPELSYLIYHLKAHGGLNISASHNHPDDNGAKLYNAAGGQEVPPYDEELVNVASSVRVAQRKEFVDAVHEGLVRFLERPLREEYIALNASLSLVPSARGAKIAFSSLHGTGSTTAYPALLRAGFEVVLTEEQLSFDGSFPTVPGRAPNPEIPAAMNAVIETAKRNGCDVAMATDPDADRLGVAVIDTRGNWRCLTGNQIGVLIAWHLLSERKKRCNLAPTNFVMKTEVTTSLLDKIAKAFGVRCIGHLLVGFKYIGDVLDHLDRFGRWGDFEAKPDDFLMAMEESHGVLATPLIRDKDAANGAVLIAELASVCKARGVSLYSTLLDLYREFGYHGTALKSLTMEGAKGLSDIRKIQQSLRARPPERVAGRKVVAFYDRQDVTGVFGPIKSETDRASRDVLVFYLEDGTRLTLRPSGTEPKNKSYVEGVAAPLGAGAADEQLFEQMAVVDSRLQEILAAWEQEMIGRLRK